MDSHGLPWSHLQTTPDTLPVPPGVLRAALRVLEPYLLSDPNPAPSTADLTGQGEENHGPRLQLWHTVHTA